MKDRLLAFFNTWQAELASHRGSEHTTFAIDRQISRMRKRASLGDATLAAKAVDAFVLTNARVGCTKLQLSRAEINNASLFIRKALESATQTFDDEDVQGVLCYEGIFANWRFGPGASYGVTGTHAAEKLSQRMTCTIRAVPLVTKLRGSNYYINLYDEANQYPVPVVRGSKLASVPKNEDTERTIAIEPLGNMALQLSVGRYLEIALKRIGLDISTQQPKNKALASQAYDKGLATLDLKSCSDMIHPDLVRALFPPCWYDLLMTLRSPEVLLPSGEWIKLEMISTMGNGFTFPLMTMIISSLVYASRKGGRALFINWERNAVFGDDVIVPKNQFAYTADILSRAGFVVNNDKSYCSGSFYESCGGDFYKGHDVTPVYVKSLATDAEVYVAMNQIMTWSCRHEISCVRTLRHLVSLLAHKDPYLVPEWCNPDAGLRTALAPRHYRFLRPQLSKVLYTGHPVFELMLAVGGYLESGAAGRLFFTPREFRKRWKTVRGRIPQGYDDGWDPLLRSPRESSWATLMVSLI